MITSVIVDVVRKFLPSGRLARSVTVLAGGNALAQLVGIAAYPILTRLYAPDDFGLVAVYTAILGLLTVIVTGRYEQAIPLPKQGRAAMNVVALTLAFTVTISILCAAGLWFFGDWLLDLMKSQRLRPYLWLLPIAVLGAGTYQTLNYWATRRRLYRRLAQTRFNQSLSSAATGISVGLFHSGPLGLLLASILAQTAGISTLAGDAWRAARVMRFRLSRTRLLHTAYIYRQFPIYSCAAGLCNSAGLQLPALLLVSFYGSEVTGWFGLAQRTVLLPMGLVGQAVSKVFLGEASQLIHTAPEQLATFFNRVTLRLLPLCLLVAVLGCISPFVFGIVFGAKFAPAGTYAGFLAISCGAQLLVSPISTVAILVKRQDLQLVLDIVRVGAVVAALYVPWLAGLPAIFAVGTFALVMGIVYILSFLVYYRLTRAIAVPAANV